MDVLLEYDGGNGVFINKENNNINIEYDGGGAYTSEFGDNNIVKTILNKRISRIIGGKK